MDGWRQIIFNFICVIYSHVTRQVGCRDVTEFTLTLGQLLVAKVHSVDVKSEVVIVDGHEATLLAEVSPFSMNHFHVLLQVFGVTQLF